MMKRTFNRTGIVSALAGTILLFACEKDKTKPTPVTPVPEPTKWEVIPGDYKIYDTLGNYLYDMSISHWTSYTQEGYRRDTFLFENLDGQFSIKAYQPEVTPSNWPKYTFYLGHHAPLYDVNNDRWQLFESMNYCSSDSLYINFELENIQYYIEDARPYESREVKVIGIKQL